MSILGSIITTIFNHGKAPATPASTSTPAAPSESPAPAPAAPTAPETPAAPAAEPASAAPAPAAPTAPVDIDAVLTQMASTHHGHLDWKHSIVDLMKVLNLDSSLAARRELATELHYSGDEHDTAAMNIWLHKQVIAELVKNGGKVPDELKH
jgi:pyruvate/2-oxoglutarate dehydrogenase complex dihydrolipoamide acyltransferase (E2) component